MKRIRILFAFIVIASFVFSCTSDSNDGNVGTSGDAAHSGTKEKSLRGYNLEQEKKLKKKSIPCDTLSLKQYVLDNYEAGTLLVEMDRTYSYSVPKYAVIYTKQQNKQYVFAVIAKSKPGERNIETKNVVGYESSFINLDSTKLGTAFFFLTLYQCENETFTKVWESEVPIHGSFNKMTLKKWKSKSTLYVELNYEEGIISGFRNYNFFMVDGIDKPPHLLETYIGIPRKRTMANVNSDKFPDYYEYRYNDNDSTYRITLIDSIPFYWSEKKNLYITDRNSRWWRKY